MKIEDGKVYLTFDGQEKELDISNEADLKKLGEQAEKGYAYEGGQQSLKELKSEKDEYERVLNVWNTRIDAAKTDPSAKELLIADLKKQGLDLSDIEKGEEPDANIVLLQKEIAELKANNNNLNDTVYGQLVDAEHTALEEQYSSEKGYPKYDRKVVQEYADKNRIASFNTAYVEMNKEEIIDVKAEE